MIMVGEFKQVILVRDDLKLSKGKLAAQVSHASVDCLLKSDKDDMLAWKDQGMKKVILRVKDLKEMFGTIGQCVAALYLHQMFHVGQVACARKAAGHQKLFA